MNPALLALILTQAQAHWLTVSYNIGAEHGYPYTIAALVWQESSFCVRTNHLDGSHSCGGVRLQTAEYTEHRHVSLGEIDDPRANMVIAADFFSLCIKHSDSWRRAVAEYHYGIPKGSRMAQKEIDADKYVLSVAAKVKMLEQVRVDTK